MSVPDPQDRAEVKARLSDRNWRLNNLYKIRDKAGTVIRFTLNHVQEDLEDELHYRNLVLKSRQHGVTTWACVRALDLALFKPNSACGLVFHKKEEAIKAFSQKIIYAYDNLPGWLRAEVPIVKRDMTGKIEFANGSTIEVSTSHRGGTLTYLHISEYGPMVAMFPLRAEEVASGALNTVSPDTIVTIESTAMGAWGDFYVRCQDATKHGRLVEAGEAIRTKLDYKIHFYAWWMDPTNKLDPTGVTITQSDVDYFDTVEARMECRIFPEQRAWYVKKKIEQKDKMLREHPSTPDEAFKGSVEGAYYAEELATLEREGRLCDLPFYKQFPVYTFWDIGRSDATAIWFMQVIGPWLHFIDYYENNNKGASHYADIITKRRDELGYRYENHFIPHDGAVADWSINDNRTRKEVLEDMKIGRVEIVKRIESLQDGIEMTRQMLGRCKFDKTKCGETQAGSGRGGYLSLSAYRKSFDEKSQTFSQDPIKSWANHGADALRQCAQGFENPREPKKPKRGARTRSALTS